MREQCGTCRWFSGDHDESEEGRYRTGTAEGLCRRMPPQVFRIKHDHLIEVVDYISRWPIVNRASMCGEWQRA